MARFLVLSDIHANMPALETALQAASGQYDKVVCLGDTVGYGPQPREAVDWLIENAQISIMGNHDQAVFDPNLLWWFNGSAKQALLYSKRNLMPRHVDFLKAQPYQAGVGPVVFIHSSLTELWAYVKDEQDALENLRQLNQYKRRVLFTGHTHVSEVFTLEGNTRVSRHHLQDGDVVDLRGENSFLINPGSIGQPRDRDTRTSFGILDLEALSYTQRRVAYDISKVQELMKTEWIDEFLIDRLTLGR